MTVKNDIISKASDELEIVDRQIIQLPEIIGEVQLNLDDLIVPASNFDRRVCELTQAVNLKVKELEVLNDLITGGCITLIPDGDGGQIPSGQVVQFDVVQGGRNDSEDTDYIGNNPFSTTVFGATTNMMGGGDFENIITGNLGVGVTTLIGVGRTFFAKNSNASKQVNDDTVPCAISADDDYDTAYPGYVDTLYSARRSALLGEIGDLRTERNNYMNDTVNELKKEIKFKYTQRYSYYFGLAKVKVRKTELENIINLANDPANETFYT
tara:strand:- start:593 stop:1396 length:804 start_codon:yes stop_codon:yes gene_type:complete